MQHNLTSLTVSDPATVYFHNGEGNFTADYGISPVIQIDTAWAEQLNQLVPGNNTNATMFQQLLASVISKYNLTSSSSSANKSFLYGFTPRPPMHRPLYLRETPLPRSSVLWSPTVLHG